MNYSNASFESNRLIPPKCHLKENKQSKSILKFANSSPVTTLLVVCCRQEHVVPKEKNMKDKAIPSLGCIYEGQTFPFGKSQQHIIISSRNSRMNQSDAAMPKTKQYLGCEVFKELQECHALCTLDILNRYITYHRISSSH